MHVECAYARSKIVVDEELRAFDYPVSSNPRDSTRTAAWCGSSKVAPARVASTAACCAASTMSYSSRCAGVKRPLAGKVE